MRTNKDGMSIAGAIRWHAKQKNLAPSELYEEIDGLSQSANQGLLHGNRAALKFLPRVIKFFGYEDQEAFIQAAIDGKNAQSAEAVNGKQAERDSMETAMEGVASAIIWHAKQKNLAPSTLHETIDGLGASANHGLLHDDPAALKFLPLVMNFFGYDDKEKFIQTAIDGRQAQRNSMEGIAEAIKWHAKKRGFAPTKLHNGLITGLSSSANQSLLHDNPAALKYLPLVVEFFGYEDQEAFIQAANAEKNFVTQIADAIQWHAEQKVISATKLYQQIDGLTKEGNIKILKKEPDAMEAAQDYLQMIINFFSYKNAGEFIAAAQQTDVQPNSNTIISQPPYPNTNQIYLS